MSTTRSKRKRTASVAGIGKTASSAGKLSSPEGSYEQPASSLDGSGSGTSPNTLATRLGASAGVTRSLPLPLAQDYLPDEEYNTAHVRFESPYTPEEETYKERILRQRPRPRDNLELMKESTQQIYLIECLRAMNALFHAPLNEAGNQTRRDTHKWTMLGRESGAPDLFIHHAHGGYFGLVIELKTRTGSVKQNQREWVERLTENGYYACIARGFIEALRIIDWYMLDMAPTSHSVFDRNCLPKPPPS